MAFPTVTIGQKIRASWGNSVAARFNDAHQALVFAPVADFNASTGAEADWITLGNITVPTWAVSAIVQMNLTAIQILTAANNIYGLRTRLGATMDGTLRTFVDHGVGVGERVEKHWHDRITIAATGSQSVKVRATRVSGTGQWQADTSSHATAVFTFLDT